MDKWTLKRTGRTFGSFDYDIDGRDVVRALDAEDGDTVVKTVNAQTPNVRHTEVTYMVRGHKLELVA
jgi:hypothetical protein